MLALTAEFDLDLFMTGYDLWITYPDGPQISHYDMKHETSTVENPAPAARARNSGSGAGRTGPAGRMPLAAATLTPNSASSSCNGLVPRSMAIGR
ncbi:hypothetical protein AB0G67_43840 [Streptomyces sp. NPDC021056]|uniref:hypothetical protein n=1 Tax=Streptomyces sp. NPDC021056 TaxID=3155012 RepID=UPI0033F592A9